MEEKLICCHCTEEITSNQQRYTYHNHDGKTAHLDCHKVFINEKVDEAIKTYESRRLYAQIL